MSATLYLLEVVAYDPDTASTVTLRYASGGGHTTGPAETPANMWYDARLSNPLDITRSLFGGARTQGRARVSAGDIKLNNADGGLDGLLDYAFDGRDVTLRRGTVGAAYPSGFPVVFQGTAESIEIRRTEAILRTRDALFALNQPLQTTTYDGDNVLPDGLEGVAADLKGKPKPFALGTVKNIAPPCVNTAKLIYQVADAAIDSVEGVFDRGIELVNREFAAAATPSFSTTNISALTFGDGLFVAGGDSGKIATSPDGDTWTQRTNGFTNAIRGLAYGNGVYVAVGEGGTPASTARVETSPDGTTWTVRASGAAAFTSSDIINVAWSERHDLFIAVGRGGQIATSPDGATWTAQTTGLSGILFGVAAGGALIVVVGESGVIATSPDGVTWTQQSSPTSSTLQEVRAGRDLFMAVGNSGAVLRSVNGTEWEELPAPTVSNILSLGYGGGHFFMAAGLTGGGGNVTMNYSPDGSAWTPYPFVFATSINQYAAGANRLVCVGASGNIAVAALFGADYADATELEDDDEAPLHGQVRVLSSATGSYVRLGSPPAGLITADITQGATAADRTAAQLWTDVLTKAGYTSADWSTSDVTALGVANDAECGLWIGPSETPTIAEVLDRIARSVGAAWYCDADGLFRIVQVTAPSGTAVLSLTANDLLEPLTLLPAQDEGRGVPVYEAVVRYAKNYVVQNSDLAFGVSDARRATLAAEWREAVATTASVQTTHLLAPRLVVETLIANAADAATEATRLQTLYGTQRRVWEVTTQLNADTAVVDLGDVVELTHDRYGLSAGVLTRVLSIEPNAARSRLRMLLWG